MTNKKIVIFIFYFLGFVSQGKSFVLHHKDSMYLKNAFTVKIGGCYLDGFSGGMPRAFGVAGTKIMPSYGLNILWSHNATQAFGFELGIRYFTTYAGYRHEDLEYSSVDTSQGKYDLYKYIIKGEGIAVQNVIGLDWNWKMGDKIKFKLGLSPAYANTSLKPKKASVKESGIILSKKQPYIYSYPYEPRRNDSLEEFIEESDEEPRLPNRDQHPNKGSANLFSLSTCIGVEKSFKVGRYAFVTGIELIASVGITMYYIPIAASRHEPESRRLTGHSNTITGCQAYIGFSIGKWQKRKLYSYR